MRLPTYARSRVRALLDYLPKGESLPEDVWRVRHRTLSYLLRAHVVGIFVYAILRGYDVTHAALEAGIVFAFAVAASDRRHRRLSSVLTAVGLVASSAVLVHLSGGLIEMHFHFFVMVGILTLYQDWTPFLAAIGFVVLHHGVLGTAIPHEVYNHPDAVRNPFKWAFIHGGFVLAASVASVIAWRLNEEQALKDSLTGLPNRRLFQDRVGHALARSQRNPGSVAVLFIDLDGFKDVNDSLGHAAGDHLLALVAERLRASLRPADTPARLGGDEFAVLVEDLGSIGSARDVAERLLAALAVPFEVRGKEMAIGASVGIAIATAGVTVEDLLRNADVAMYTVKTGGRGRFELFQPAMHEAVVERVALEQDLLRAVDGGEFVLHYQPIMSLHTNRLVGLEALIRWQHPQRGLLLPGDFLDIAEQTGAIVPIGDWVIEEACRQARVFADQFPHAALVMGVNLSPAQLFRERLVDVVRAALKQTGMDPARFVLELTEGIMVRGADTTIERLNELKTLGVLLAIDDFGTGYSSLSYLRRLPVDILKIDKTFVDGIAGTDKERAFTESIVQLAKTLQLTTVAEGVERPDQVDALRALGCQLAQGYRFARPLHGARGLRQLHGEAEALDRTGPGLVELDDHLSRAHELGLQRLQGRGLVGGRRIGHDDDGRPGRGVRPQTGHRPREVVGPVRGDKDDGREAGRRLPGAAGDVGRRPEADSCRLRDIGWSGGRQGEVRPPVDDLPASRLDGGAEPVRRRPVAGCPRSRPLMGDGQDLVRDEDARHAQRLRRARVR